MKKFLAIISIVSILGYNNTQAMFRRTGSMFMSRTMPLLQSDNTDFSSGGQHVGKSSSDAAKILAGGSFVYALHENANATKDNAQAVRENTQELKKMQEQQEASIKHQEEQVRLTKMTVGSLQSVVKRQDRDHELMKTWNLQHSSGVVKKEPSNWESLKKSQSDIQTVLFFWHLMKPFTIGYLPTSVQDIAKKI